MPVTSPCMSLFVGGHEGALSVTMLYDLFCNRVHHLVFTLNLCQWLEKWKIKLFDHIARSGDDVRLEAFTFKLLHQLFIFLLLFFFELVFRNRNLIFFTDRRFISNDHDVEAFGPTGRAKRCVDAKFNTLESEGKCSLSTENRPNVPINLTWNWQERKQSRIRERIGWDSEYLSHRRIGKLCRYSKWQKDIKCERVINKRVGRIRRCTKR